MPSGTFPWCFEQMMSFNSRCSCFYKKSLKLIQIYYKNVVRSHITSYPTISLLLLLLLLLLILLLIK